MLSSMGSLLSTATRNRWKRTWRSRVAATVVATVGVIGGSAALAATSPATNAATTTDTGGNGVGASTSGSSVLEDIFRPPFTSGDSGSSSSDGANQWNNPSQSSRQPDTTTHGS